MSHGDNGEYAQRERARRLERFGRENLAVTESSRLAATLGGLSLATDLVAGLPSETALRTATLAGHIGRELGLAADREVEVLTLVARGLSNKEVGRRLFISPRTVRSRDAEVSSRAKAELVLFPGQ